jgi:hypothetical protein
VDRLDWEFDKGGVIWTLIVYAALASLVIIAAGYLLHVGWSLYDPG